MPHFVLLMARVNNVDRSSSICNNCKIDASHYNIKIGKPSEIKRLSGYETIGIKLIMSYN